MVDGLNVKSIITLLAMPLAFMAFIGVVAFVYYKLLPPIFNKLEKMEAKENKGRNIDPFWPDIRDIETAIIVARKNGKIYYLLAVIIGSLSALQFWGFTWLGLIDALVFTVVGFGIHKMSRSAAVIGILFYILPRIYAVFSGQIIINIAILLVFMLSFINTIRATFKYHKLKEAA